MNIYANANGRNQTLLRFEAFRSDDLTHSVGQEQWEIDRQRRLSSIRPVFSPSRAGGAQLAETFTDDL
jgi:hypothetical protein